MDETKKRVARRIYNNPDLMVEDMLKGFLKANKHIVKATDNPRVVKSVHAPVRGKVGIVTGGGSGHKPAFVGYVGRHMCDAVAVGEIFASPTAVAFLDAFKAANGGAGVACLYGNYAGDNMNVKMAIKMAEKEGITVKTVVANDDCASAPKTELEKRRGVAGEVLMWKIGGAKAAMGASLDEVIAVAQKTINQTRSVGIGTAPCTLVSKGSPNFSIEDGTMEVGIGHHGEPGVRVEPLGSANEIAEKMLGIILPDLPFAAGDDVAVLVSGLGATPVMEQYIVYDRIEEILEEKGIHVYRSYVGDYFTSLEMMGVTLTVLKLDDELKECLDYPAETMGLTQFGAENTTLAQFEAADEAQAVEAAQAEAVKVQIEVEDNDDGTAAFLSKDGGCIVDRLIKAIQEKKDYLSEVDGLIGDGDHGVNMNKGFTMCEDKLKAKEEGYSLGEALDILSKTLMDGIGGSMGPLYGTFFGGLGDIAARKKYINAKAFGEMISEALAGIQSFSPAKRGDKTLMDTLIPGQEAYMEALKAGKGFAECLDAMTAAAEAGWKSTEDMVAKIGRASRLGERSRGVLDAGSTSCFIILSTIAEAIKALIA